MGADFRWWLTLEMVQMSCSMLTDWLVALNTMKQGVYLPSRPAQWHEDATQSIALLEPQRISEHSYEVDLNPVYSE